MVAGVGVAAASLHADVRKRAPSVRRALPQRAERTHKVPLDVVVECLERADVKDTRRPGFKIADEHRLIDHRNAVSVLPLPVGAVMSACSPRSITGQDCSWTSVGEPSSSWNQASIWGWNRVSASLVAGPVYQAAQGSPDRTARDRRHHRHTRPHRVRHHRHAQQELWARQRERDRGPDTVRGSGRRRRCQSALARPHPGPARHRRRRRRLRQSRAD